MLYLAGAAVAVFGTGAAELIVGSHYPWMLVVSGGVVFVLVMAWFWRN